MGAQQNWQCQGRQYHGWFGSGTCADNHAQDARADAADAEQARHILAVLYGTIGVLPAPQRPRWEAWLQRGNAARFANLLTTWAGSAHDADDLAARFLPDGTGDRTATALHDAATAAAGARDTAGEVAASVELAAAVQVVGMDRWARLVGAAEEKGGASGPNRLAVPGSYQIATTGDKTFGLPKIFWNWYHRQQKLAGDADLDRAARSMLTSCGSN